MLLHRTLPEHHPFACSLQAAALLVHLVAVLQPAELTVSCRHVPRLLNKLHLLSAKQPTAQLSTRRTRLSAMLHTLLNKS